MSIALAITIMYGRQVNDLKKFLIIIAALILCFLFSSFGLIVVYPFRAEAEIDTAPDENMQKIYSVIDVVNGHNVEISQSESSAINKFADVFASNMFVKYAEIALSIESNAQSPVITVYFIDWDKVSLKNNTIFEFSTYNDYIPRLEYDAMNQIYQIANDTSLYTKEYQIRVTFKNKLDNGNPQAVLNQEDLSKIYDECYEAAESIYSKYLSTSDMSAAFFCKSIKELTTDNIVDIYNTNYPDNQINDEWQKQLFASYAQHYIDNLVIENIIKASAADQVSTGTINYQIEDGVSTIDKTLTILLEHYYQVKQPPVEREQVISDFGDQLMLYNYSDDTSLYAKSFDFTYTQNLNEFTIENDFYNKIVAQIYEEFILFENIFNVYYPQMEALYFYHPRPFDGTTIIIDNTEESRYRQLDIVVSGQTDCYIKLYSYDIVNDILMNTVFSAYIKAGESLHIFIPEGDYVFKYATGQIWYGDVHKFSDEGQYYMSSDVISVHDYMMTTKIELGSFDSGSVPVNQETPDLF